ncbi:MAG: hypothetical protein NTZ38_01125, partial [Candidatus Taylorbacteria bacterium]|nr:hypothetical protein [Candidatus Taylorbacteria bacterium]
AGKWNIIGLGTSMGSYNMYPYTRNGAGNGLYSISTTASYSTQTYRFAAVKIGVTSLNSASQVANPLGSFSDFFRNLGL